VTGIQIDPALLRTMPLPELPEESDKEARGRVLIVAGGPQVPGAPLLTGLAALRTGAGKLQLAAPRAMALALGVAAPEAGIVALPVGADGEIGPQALPALAEAAKGADAIVVGPGMMGAHTASVATETALMTKGALVLDAGALSGLLDHAQRLRGAAGRLVITPHAGEMASLLGWTREQVTAEPDRAAGKAAQVLGAVVALKGETTRIAHPDGRAWIHTGGVVGLGTSGSGDVLAGIIAGLLARGAPPHEAAIRGVFVHGRAGERLSQTVGALGFLAREIVDAVPAALSAAEG